MLTIVIVFDALPLGQMGCYGSEWVETPHLDALALDGFVFDQCLSHRPSAGAWRSAVFSGQSPVGVPPPPADQPTILGNMLRRAGIPLALITDEAGFPETARAGGWLADGASVDFCTVDPLPRDDWASLEVLRSHPSYRLPPDHHAAFVSATDRWREQLGRRQAMGDGADRAIEQVFAVAGEWLAVRPQRGVLWIETAVAGGSWLPPSTLVDKYRDEETPEPIVDPLPSLLGEVIAEEDLLAVQAGWAARLGYLDRVVGAFVELLRELALFDRCALLLTANQGYPLGQHQALGMCQPWLYEERVHLPLLVRLPGGRRAGRSPALVQPVDGFATLCSLLDLGDQVPTAARDLAVPIPTRSVDLVPLLKGEMLKVRDYACYGLDDREYGIQANTWKLLMPVGRQHPPRQRLLFARPEDRWDMNDLASQHEAVADRLELALRRYLDAEKRDTFDELPPFFPDAPD